MKKNLFFFVSVIVFVGLFYNQSPGINISFFGLMTWLFLLGITPAIKRTQMFWALSVTSLVSVGAFAWYGDFICFAALFLSLLLTGFKAFYPRLNVLVLPFNTAFNYITFIFRVLTPQKWLGVRLSSDGLAKKAISYVLIPAAFAAIFIGVYTAASDKFASLLVINLEFDFLQLAVLTVLGFFLMFNFFYSSVPKAVIACNGYLKDDFSDGFVQRRNKRFHLLDVISQRRSGEISLILLNAVLIFFIIIYGIEQFGTPGSSGTLSNDVHERVYVLILSIVMAIGVIMIYFQGLLNFDTQSGLLKKLSFIWIGLNVLLIGTVFFQNMEYIVAYGLTFKRIGVFIFLLLSLFGLFITWVKLKNRKTNIFLINRMVWAAFYVLVVSSLINWGWIVTLYNTSHFANPDWNYLNSLHYNRQLLNTIYKEKGMPDTEMKRDIDAERSDQFLSKRLYFEFLDVQ
ncbi:DUF4153 domain-containing protein [Niabella yanshanensis]|uniref:DUF4153 domain-containing protein n=1 Tax=Niabella yanshanensis TaxID=577386 RepID=A0ABZ0WAS8_9BACT|nr:DUF4153 domain-containing protein [Niabella yanshanensis]WQD40402.1 DUF4153 domain-containing protein [Niabella yanshanensis]